MGRFILSGHNIDDGITPVYTRNAGHPFFTLRGVKATIQVPLGAAQTADKPSNIASGDYLLVAVSDAPGMATPVGWRRILNSTHNQYDRNATGTSADDFVIPVGSDAETGRIAVYIAFGNEGNASTPSYADAPAMVTAANGAESFVISALNANGAVTNTLALVTSVRSGFGVPASPPTPVLTGASGGEWTIAKMQYRLWSENAVNRFSYCAIAYKLESNADAFGTEKYLFSQWEDTTNPASSGSTSRALRVNHV